jgi:hypothetical protein
MARSAAKSTERVAITDIDWAPDFVIDSVAATLVQIGVQTTWFVTHSSPAVDSLRDRAKDPSQFPFRIDPGEARWRKCWRLARGSSPTPGRCGRTAFTIRSRC